MLWSLPDELQTMGMALCIILIHCGGDVPATPIMGAIQESQAGTDADDATVVRSWRIMFWCAEGVIMLAVMCWAAALYFAQRWVIEGTPSLRYSLLHDEPTEELSLPPPNAQQE